LPDGRIFGKIIQNRPQKIIFGREKSVAGKPPNLFNSCRKEAKKSFIEVYKGKPPILCHFCSFKIFSFFFIIFEFSILLIIFSQLKHSFLDICLEVAEFLKLAEF
jgi:hypothetical protein